MRPSPAQPCNGPSRSRLLQASLFEDRLQRTPRYIGAQLARDGDDAALGRMLVLAVAPAGPSKKPAVPLDQPDHLDNLQLGASNIRPTSTCAVAVAVTRPGATPSMRMCVPIETVTTALSSRSAHEHDSSRAPFASAIDCAAASGRRTNRTRATARQRRPALRHRQRSALALAPAGRWQRPRRRGTAGQRARAATASGPRRRRRRSWTAEADGDGVGSMPTRTASGLAIRTEPVKASVTALAPVWAWARRAYRRVRVASSRSRAAGGRARRSATRSGSTAARGTPARHVTASPRLRCPASPATSRPRSARHRADRRRARSQCARRRRPRSRPPRGRPRAPLARARGRPGRRSRPGR